MEPTQDKKSYGALVGSVIIIVLLVLGGIYFWMSKQVPVTPPAQVEESYTETDPLTSELNDLESELNQGASLEAEFDVSTVE